MKSKRATKTSPAASEAPDDPASETDAFDASQPSQAHGQEAQVEQRPRSKGKKGSKEKPPTKGGRPVGAQGYSESDTMALLTLIDQDLPRGGNEWDRVRDQYNAQHALVEGRDTRTTDSLKSRFRHVLAPAAPSGKTRCSALRTMAVEIQQRIMNKVHNVTVDDSQSLEERSDNDEYDENSASEHDEDSENQSNVNSLPSTQASGAAEADSTSQQTEQPRLKRSRSTTQIQPKHLRCSTKVEGAKPKRVIRGSGMSLWSRHTEEQAAHRGNREIQSFFVSPECVTSRSEHGTYQSIDRADIGARQQARPHLGPS
ncbi:hypothetical protein AM587_10001245 [Phytophthora nicotianae]|uniref:DUF6818 domain-containing protein n=1 Tax=Phytophthora nicotianae TaxID=4792 RepID=A0A0W8BYF8_PHYNI|nr:hypothetical protein AM587_10001245 [Phytophthora nicotianae]